MYLHPIVVLSRNHCCEVRQCGMCIIDLPVTVNNKKHCCIKIIL